MFRGQKLTGKIEKGLTIEEWKEKDISTCILSGDPECALEKGTVGNKSLTTMENVFIPLLQASDLPVAYLCGQEPYCIKIGDRRALRQAKRNVEQSFPVVGVLEELSKIEIQTRTNP